MTNTIRETAEAILGLPAESSVFSDGWENYIDTEDLKALARAYLEAENEKAVRRWAKTGFMTLDGLVED